MPASATAPFTSNLPRKSKPVWMRPLNRSDLTFIASHLRERDAREIFASRWREDPRDLVEDCYLCREFGWIFGKESPVCAIGAFPVWPGVWSVWMFATDDWKKVAFSVTKHAKKVIFPVLKARSHRTECRSDERHTTAHRWLEMLGARREHILPHYGKNGENFYLYSWLTPENISQPLPPDVF